MLLDHYLYTGDDDVLLQYMPLLASTLEFFAMHYGDVRLLDGERLVVFPTQSLEISMFGFARDKGKLPDE